MPVIKKGKSAAFNATKAAKEKEKRVKAGAAKKAKPVKPAKPKAGKKSSAPEGNWFAKMTKAAQTAYLKSHPNSKYGKGSKPVKRSATKKAGKVDAAKPKSKKH